VISLPAGPPASCLSERRPDRSPAHSDRSNDAARATAGCRPRLRPSSCPRA
jgi:hypothetical protein